MKRWAVALRLVGMGWYVAACIVLGLVGGIWLDSIVHTRPVFMLIGLFLGLGLAFFGVYRALLPLLQNSQGKESDR